MSEMTKKQFEKIELNSSNILKFAIPSIIGFFIFLVPISYNGKFTIPVGHVLSYAANLFATNGFSMTLATWLMIITAILSTAFTFGKFSFVKEDSFLSKGFVTSTWQVLLRIVGAIIAAMIYFETGLAWIIDPWTGGVALELTANIMVWFIVASFFIPLLFDFGLMEFFGTVLSVFTRPLFKLPGRATIDMITSFIGDQNLGIMITNQQYKDGFYTGREAAVIATCFSATGIGYWFMMAEESGVSMYFVPLYATIIVASIVSTFIMVRIWPITSIKNEFHNGAKNIVEDNTEMGMSKVELGVQLGVQKAQNFKGIKAAATRSLNLTIEVICAILPIVVLIGTIGLVIDAYTPFFNIISYPLHFYYELLGLSDAATAAAAGVAGFADVMLPSLMIAGVASAKTRFVVCVLSLIQIIYMSEVGPILLLSEIPVKMGKLIQIFLVKTIIALPVIVLMANLFGIPN